MCNILEDVKDLGRIIIKICTILYVVSDIEACHRLHKKANHNQEPRNVIVVRFVNRGKM